MLRITITRLPSGAYAAAVQGGNPHHRHKREVFVIARVTFTIAAGKTVHITVTLKPLGRGLLNSKGQLKAPVRILATGAAKPINRVVTIVHANPSGHKKH